MDKRMGRVKRTLEIREEVLVNHKVIRLENEKKRTSRIPSACTTNDNSGGCNPLTVKGK